MEKRSLLPRSLKARATRTRSYRPELSQSPLARDMLFPRSSHCYRYVYRGFRASGWVIDICRWTPV